MAHVEASIYIQRNTDALWNKVGSFQGVGEWHPMLKSVRGSGEQPGAIRKASGGDGQEQMERLEQRSDNEHAYRYSMVSSPMPVRDYVAVFGIADEKDGKSRVFWEADFQVTNADEAKTIESVRTFFQSGLESLRSIYG
jgi:hypothetical protein